MTAPKFAELEEWHWREWCESTGIWCQWREARELVTEVERMPSHLRAAWIMENEAELDAMNLGADGNRKIAKALARGADTPVGRFLAEHDARFSSRLNFWLSKAMLPGLE